MYFRNYLFAFLLPFNLFSQSAKEKDLFGEKMSYRDVKRYYKAKTNLPQNWIGLYTKLLTGRKGRGSKNRLLAYKLIERLSRSDRNAFSRLMQMRLAWEFKEHLTSTEPVKPFLKNTIDSAGYYYMMTVYFKDSIMEKIARRMGYMKGGYEREIVDWAKMKWMKWNSEPIERSSHGYYIDTTPLISQRMKDSCIQYYKAAIDHDPAEFFYAKEFFFFLSQHNKEKLQEIIKPYLNNYSPKQQQWLTARLQEVVTKRVE
jgi:hypothetical protein